MICKLAWRSASLHTDQLSPGPLNAAALEIVEKIQLLTGIIRTELVTEASMPIGETSVEEYQKVTETEVNEIVWKKLGRGVKISKWLRLRNQCQPEQKNPASQEVPYTTGNVYAI